MVLMSLFRICLEAAIAQYLWDIKYNQFYFIFTNQK